MDVLEAEKEVSVSTSASGLTPQNSSEGSVRAPSSLAESLYEQHNGRPYLTAIPYPLPCDLVELQRQSVRTLLMTKLLGGPLCSPIDRREAPETVLEIACGSAYWSTLCHDHLVHLGCRDVRFVGLDLVQQAADLGYLGLPGWNFVQFDLRRGTLPFENASFDLVMHKDLSLVVPQGKPSQKLLEESIRVLRPGGILEVWDVDHVIRSLLPHQTAPVNKRKKAEYDNAVKTGSFIVTATTPFAAAQNPYLLEYNSWVHEALDRRRLSSTPCSTIAQALLQETESLVEVDFRRVAVPLGELRWNRDTGAATNKSPEASQAKRTSASSKTKSRSEPQPLNLSARLDEQNDLRFAALYTVVQMIESLEPFLMEVSNKPQEEWQRWWAGMMSNLLEHKGASSGECLEIGAWWARKVQPE